MSLALNRILNPRTGSPESSIIPKREPGINISVIFTFAGATVAALKRAGNLAEYLDARITLVVPQIVPYPLPLESPPMLLEFQERRFREIARQCPAEIWVRVYLCRDALGTLKEMLEPRSLVVLGGRRRFWLTQEQRLARKLRRMGHEVIFTETN